MLYWIHFHHGMDTLDNGPIFGIYIFSRTDVRIMGLYNPRNIIF